MELRDVSSLERSRRLPPPEAWKHPSQWIDLSTGLAQPDIPRLVLPTDDRGLIKPDEVVHLVNDFFFWPDYDWPFDPRDPETAPDDHHFYFTARSYQPERNGGSEIPHRFRELPTHIGRMPRQFHNVLHDFTIAPEKPAIDTMQGYCDSYSLAERAFKKLIKAAKNAADAQTKFGMRRRSLESGYIEPSSAQDAVAQEFLRSFFTKHFEAYSESVEQWRSLAPSDRALLELPEVQRYKPQYVVRRLGGAATRRYINYVPVLGAA